MSLLRIRPEADRDADAAAEYLAIEANLDIAIQFLAALELAYQRLVEHPHIGTPVKALRATALGASFLACLRIRAIPGLLRAFA